MAFFAQNIIPRIPLDVNLCSHPALPGGPLKLPGCGSRLGIYLQPRAFCEAERYPPLRV